MACVYGLWLLAGTLDFHFHRRTDIAHTSGLRESALHGAQLSLIGAGLLAWLALAHTCALILLLTVAAILHAIVGYLDTASADGRRRISPLEQHVHSILDMAPWVFLAWVAWNAQTGWGVRWQPAPARLWLSTILPALALAGLPWLAELRRCVRAAPHDGRAA